MGIIKRLTASAAVTRLRAPVGRLRRSIMSQRPAVRWGLALATLLGLAAAGYWGATSLVPVGVRYLASGRRFSSEDLNKICRVLDAQRIEYRSTISTRSQSTPTSSTRPPRWSPSWMSGLARLMRPAIRSTPGASWLEGPREREQKEKLAREKMVESMIRKLDGYRLGVGLDQSPPRLGLASHGRQADGVCLHRDRG